MSLEDAVKEVIDAWDGNRDVFVKFDDKYVIYRLETFGEMVIFVSKTSAEIRLPPPEFYLPRRHNKLTLELEYGAKLAELLEAMAVKGSLMERMNTLIRKVKEIYGDAILVEVRTVIDASGSAMIARFEF